MGDALDGQATLFDPSSQAEPEEPEEPEEPAPQPPSGVPPTALWVDAEQEWQHSATDDAGALHGPFRSWRADGTLRTIGTHSHGKRVGPTWRFHPDGSLFELGTFVDGTPRGSHRRYASAHSQVERLQSCCVPQGAWQLRQDYDRGEMYERAWFNRDGARLMDSGELYPERPATVPARARFNENLNSWEAGGIWEETGYTGSRKRWSLEGVLRLAEDVVRGKRHGGVRSFDEFGTLAWEGRYADGRLSGAFRALGLPEGHFSDATVRDEEGSFFEDQAVDLWRVRDQTGAVRAERDLGQALDEEALTSSPVFANEQRSAAAWGELADALFAQRRVAEALLASARATAAAADPEALTTALAAWTILLAADAARTQAQEVVERAAESLLPLVDALKRGGDAAILLWALGKALHSAERAALDFVTAALLLRPDWTEPLTTRALLHGSLGDLSSARADIARLRGESPDGADVLDLVLRAYFPRFDFWPARQTFPIHPEGAVLQPERDVPEVRDLIMRYATRLHRLRTALRARVADDAAFMIPDLSSLLPSGPVPLTRFTFTMSPEEYGGEGAPTAGEHEAQGALEPIEPPLESPLESIEIIVDETQGLSLEATTLLTILRQARIDWSGLTWLCWAVGLDAPGLPVEIRPPSIFGSAAMMTMARTWRCRDKLNTSGLLALTKGIPGFDWEGTPIDLVPVTLANVALGEYLEARAVFSWLCDHANRSPWQDDLRNAD